MNEYDDRIVAYLNERLDEEEGVALRAAFGWGAEWTVNRQNDDSAVLAATGTPRAAWSEDIDVITHAAAWNPARALLSIETRRVILKLYAGAQFALDCHADDAGEQGHVEGIRKVVRILLQEYVGRPDYPQPEGTQHA